MLARGTPSHEWPDVLHPRFIRNQRSSQVADTRTVDCLPATGLHPEPERPSARRGWARHQDHVVQNPRVGTLFYNPAAPHIPAREPPGTPPAFPTVHSCGGPVPWMTASPFSECSQCGMSVTCRLREVDRPVCSAMMRDVPETVITIPTESGQNHQKPTSIPRLSVELSYFRWATVRQHPDSAERVILSYGAEARAMMDRRTAAFLRYRLLSVWQTHDRYDNIRFNENDVAAFILAWYENRDSHPFPESQPARFPSRNHIFLPMSAWDEPGMYRQARIDETTIDIPPFHPCSSAYTPVAPHQGPLVWEVYNEWLATDNHPYKRWMLNSLRFGFSLLFKLPITRRQAPPLTFRPDNREQLQRLLDTELGMGSLIPWPKELTRSNLRFALFFAVPKPDGSYRGVGDMSFGKLSLNERTRRGGHILSRLASIRRMVDFCNNFFASADPEERLEGLRIFKFDATKAYRRVPIPAREYYATAHNIDNKVYVNTSQMMGASASGDNMSHTVSVIRDRLATDHDIFSETYIDDHIFVVPATTAPVKHEVATMMWQRSGYGQQLDKYDRYGRPGPVGEVLGIMFDPTARVMYVSRERAEKTVAVINQWLEDAQLPQRRKRTTREYSSLAGKLFFISQIFPLARAFVGSFYRFSTMATAPDHEGDTGMDGDVLADLVWWRHMLTANDLPTVSFADSPRFIQRTLISDASNTGYGAVCHDVKQLLLGPFWQHEVESSFIMHREAFAIGCAVAVWAGGRAERAGDTTDTAAAPSAVSFLSDSTPCVLAFNRHRSRDYRLRQFMRVLCMIQIHTRVPIIFSYIPTTRNVDADDLSRDLSIPSRLHDYTQTTVPHTWMAILRDILLRWHSVPSTTVTSITRQYELLTSTVSTLACSEHSTLPWTRWSEDSDDYMILRTGFEINDRMFNRKQSLATSPPSEAI